MHVIFLDFDGCLNTENSWNNVISFDDWILLDKVALINKIIAATNAAVVVSSDWRMMRSVEDLQSILDRRGFTGKIIGKTDVNDKARFDQISDWIDANTHVNIDKMIIVDDMDVISVSRIGFQRLRNSFMIKCDPRFGLTDELADLAIKKLLG